MTHTFTSRIALLRSIAAAFVLVFANNAFAQERTLDWPSISVQAHLDADGRLHVRETQEIRFTGDWNGARRDFIVPLSQRFKFDSIVRVSGSERTRLAGGELDNVDEYEMESSELRWRSRLPTDPPFDNTVLVYELFFSYADILSVDGDNQFGLNHDFLFANRDSEVSRFTLRLSVDDAWKLPVGSPTLYEADSVAAGNGYVVSLPLTRVALSKPAAVRLGAAPPVRYSIAAAFVLFVSTAVARLLRHDTRKGRFNAQQSLDSVTREFLDREVYSHRPEVVGTAWDNHTSQAEVSAIIARMVQEGKLSTNVESSKVLVFSKDVLHLRLTVSRESLSGYERELVNALFNPGAVATNTDEVRKRYEKSGFDPAKVVSGALKKEAKRITGWPAKSEKPSRRPSQLLAAAGVLCMIVQFFMRPGDAAPLLLFSIAGVALYLFALVCASLWQTRVLNVWRGGVPLSLLMFALVYTMSVIVLGNRIVRLDVAGLTALALLASSAIWSITNNARLRATQKGIVARRNLALAREWYKQELKQTAPRFGDEAFPYLLAFGLGSHVDKWFKAFGGESSLVSTTVRSSPSVAGAGSISGTGGDFAGFGGAAGGRGFTGGGGGARFGAAIGGIASSVPSPSSSSSGGGGSSGGGRSGGGGGGGW